MMTQIRRRLLRTSPWIMVVAVAIAAAGTCHAFQLHALSFTSSRTSFRSCRSICTRYAESVSLSAREGKNAALTTTGAANRRNKCGYFFEGRWEQRKNLADLEIGDKLFGRKLDGHDLLEATTGPKIFFECGVGRLDAKGNWHMVNGMLRLGRRGARKSATKKRMARITNKVVDLFVSRIDTANGRLEVTTSLEKAEEVAVTGDKKTPASSLKAGDELTGTVVKVRDYGVPNSARSPNGAWTSIAKPSTSTSKNLKRQCPAFMRSVTSTSTLGKKLILCGFHEAAMAAFAIKQQIEPDKKVRRTRRPVHSCTSDWV